ncbi:MAG: hypothetical protein PF440_05930 [Thiomicrorhabdus sp.]|jgi:hypothetical protein|nr:hypothetical protein [Thiomicrorhabdus sp.]
MIEKILIGITLFVVTSVIAYLFRMRQLYVVAPKLYRHASISEQGVLCELIVFNKGNQVEENIKVELDPDLNVELLAANSDDILLKNSTLNIERLHKGKDLSVMLLIENGRFDSTKIVSITSKLTDGKVLKKEDELPPNFAKAFIAAVLFIGFFPAVTYSSAAYEKLNEIYVKSQLESLYKKGWSNLENYYYSDIKVSYSNTEFPISFKNSQTEKDCYQFRVYNKTALPMTVTSSGIFYESISLKPLTKGVIKVQLHKSEKLSFKFSIKVAEEFIHSINYDLKQ